MTLLLLLSATAATAAEPIRGFPPPAVRAERELEAGVLGRIDAEHMREYMRRMASKPHHAGSPGSKAVAEYAATQFREWGFKTTIESLDAWLPYPKDRLVELIEPVRYKARLDEQAIKEDVFSYQKDQLPPYNAYSAAGDVTAPLVYANYGLPADYDTLKKLGIDVRGKIVLTRYGRGWRGLKPKLAQEHGAAGCLIYSDPFDDGFHAGDVYPKGPYRPWFSVQRGSVMDMPVAVGPAAALGGMLIPVQPISYGDAKPLLEQLGGPVAPEDWRGALPLTYHIGPGAAKVRLKLSFEARSRHLYNVIATLPGRELADQWVIYGNHHDAWVFGASDPISGAVSLMETARAIGSAARGSWKPKRTIVFALWDGEEFGLMGSTGWADKHEAELKQKAVVYLNSDSNGKGSALSAGGTPLLEAFFQEVARDVKTPMPRYSALGAGSDYVAFQHHLGIAAANFGFTQADSGGVYHSAYDSIEWFRRHSDGEFANGRRLAQFMGTSILRLAEAPALPFEVTALERGIRQYVSELEDASGGRLDTVRIRAELAKLTGKGPEVSYLTERLFAADGGLPGRPWYRYLLAAPGLTTGYGAKTLPGVREAVDAGRFRTANRELARIAAMLESVNRELSP